jgi:hypothetical protein
MMPVVAKEGRLVAHEVVGGEDDHGGAVVPGLDPVGGQEDAGAGTPILRLSQDMRSPFGLPELATEVPQVARHRDHHRPLGGDEGPEALQRLVQERAATGEHGVLLGQVLVVDLPDQGPKPNALAAGQHDRPRPLARRLPRRGHPSGACALSLATD